MSGERPAEQQEKNIVNQINIMWQRGVCIQIFLENRVLNLRSGINEKPIVVVKNVADSFISTEG
jgi:DUF2075 family protein